MPIAPSEVSEKTLAVVNELLPACGPIGAYCIGMMCALAWQDGIEPGEELLRTAATCTSVEQGAEMYRTFRDLRERS